MLTWVLTHSVMNTSLEDVTIGRVIQYVMATAQRRDTLKMCLGVVHNVGVAYNVGSAYRLDMGGW